MARYTLTEDEEEKLFVIHNEFWTNLGKLVATALDQCPSPDLEDLLLMQLSDMSSVYGTDYEKHRRKTDA